MKTYVLFTFAIYGIGGTQIYARNKLLYMQSLGWKTCMVTTEPGTEILVKDLAPYQNGVFPELMQNPYLLSKVQRNKIIGKVISYIREFATANDEVIIESNFIAITPWGELIAKRLYARHFIFLIQEDYRIKSKPYLDFLFYKYQRGELAANTKNALPILFADYANYQPHPGHYMNAFCSNVIEDVPSVIEGILPKADYNIGSIGRLNKPFVAPMTQQIADYAANNQDKIFNLVFLGGSSDKKDIETVKDAVKNVCNINLHITGPLFPVPLCDVMAMDLFIASAGACRTSSNAGKLTISVDAIDYQPIGIIGVTTDQSIHRGNEPIVPLSKLLDEILIEKKYTNPPVNQGNDYSKVFANDVPYILKDSGKQEYYKIRKLAPKLSSIIYHRFLKPLLKSI